MERSGFLTRCGLAFAALVFATLLPGHVAAHEAAGSTVAKFAVSPDGTATYSIPLAVPPGTAGMEPKLSLVYSSQGGNSAYGFGWSLSGLSQITRGPRNISDDGIVSGPRLNKEDAFYLDGEKLVEVASDTPGVREFRTRIDTMARIRSYEWNETGPTHFEVETRAGLKMSYGSSAGSRVTLADGRSIGWLAARIEDRSGNFMRFRYKFDDAGGRPGLDYVLEGVDYTGNDAQGLAPYASIAFEYERRSADRSYGTRYVFGQKVDLGWQLKQAVTSYREGILRRYVPTYTATDDSDRFETIAAFTEHGGDGLHYRPLRFDYPRSRPGWEPSDLLASVDDLPGLGDVAANLSKAYRYARVPRAGGTVPGVLVGAETGGKTVRQAYLRDNASGQWKPDPIFMPPVLFAGSSGEAEDIVVIDIDGDGDDDILAGPSLGNEEGTYEATPQGWRKGAPFPIPLRGGTLASTGAIEIDTVDASGLKGIGFAWNYVDPASSRRIRDARRWDGTSGKWVAISGYDPPQAFSIGSVPTIAGARAIDVDADGIRELVYYVVSGGNGRRELYRPTAAGWKLDTAVANYLLPMPDLPSESAFRLADVNQDGRADLLWSFSTPTGRNSGVRLASPRGWQSTHLVLPAVEFWRTGSDPGTGVAGETLDLNGDGFADLVDGDLGEYRSWLGSADGWVRDDKYAPPTTLGRTASERSVAFKTLRLAGSSAWVWLGLRPDGGSLAPESYGLDAATGWQRDAELKVPVDLAQFDKVDLGLRFLDLNNDGLPDLVWSRRKNDGSLDRAVYLFDPTTPEPWRKDVRYLLPAPIAREDYLDPGTFVVDVNGDGRVDLVEGRRTREGGRLVETRETWINCAALPMCKDVAPDQEAGYWLAASTSDVFRGLVAPTVFSEDGIGPLGASALDVDGDGLTDIVTARELEIWVNEDGEEIPANDPDARPAYRLDARTWLNDKGHGWIESGDFKLPVPLVRPAIVVRGEPSDEANFPGMNVVDTRVQLVDLNGDRLPDLSYRYESLRKVKSEAGRVGVERVPVMGARLGSPTGWAIEASAYVPPVRLDDDPAAPSRQLLLEDLNRDGAIDMIFADGAQSATYLNTGLGWSEPDAAFRIPAKAIRAGKGDHGFRILDLNGDNLPDIAFHWTKEQGSERGAFINTGIAWSEAPAEFAPRIAFVEHDRGDLGIRPIDVDGDGLLDLVQSYKRSSSDTRNQVQVNRSDRPYLLSGHRDGVGSTARIRYASFLTVARPDAASPPSDPAPQVRLDPGTGRPAAYPVVHAPLPGYVVGEVIEEGPGVPARRLRYAYDGNRVDIRSGRSLGFEVTEVMDVERGRRTRTTLSQEDAILGSPLKIETWQNGVLISQTDSWWHWETIDGLAGSSGAAGFSPKILRRNLARNVARSFDLDGVQLGGEDTRFTYDAISNATRIEVVYADGSGSITENWFADDLQRWSLARVVSTRVTLTAPGLESQIREARFAYGNGGLMEEERALVGTAFELVTRYTRDRFGNKLATSTSAPDGSMQRNQTAEYDAEGRFVIALANAAGHRSTAEFDALSGALLARTDPNGLVQRYRYDSLQRPIAEISPSKIATEIVIESSGRPEAALVTIRRTTGLTEVRTWTDAAGRAVRTERSGWGGRTVISEMRFDALGRPSATVLDRFSGEPELSVERDYDALDRVVSEKRADGKIMRIAYHGLEQVTVEPDGTKSIRRHDLRGRVRETVDAIGGTTRFLLDTGGRISATQTAQGQLVVQAYDSAGHRTRLEDPTAGNWTYAYDIYGSLLSQTDPRGETTFLRYDVLGRLIEKRMRDSLATWRYDDGPNAVGHLVASQTGEDYRRSLGYDTLGRRTRVQTIHGSDALTTEDRFDALGRLTERRFDTGVTLRHRYDAAGFLVGMSLADGEMRRDVYRLIEVDAGGRVIAESIGNGIVTRNRYDAGTDRLIGTMTESAREKAQDLSLTYDVVGNIIAMTDSVTGESGSFEYDALRRLTRTQQSGRTDVAVAYDAIGNILSKSDVGTYNYCDRDGLKGLLCNVSGPETAMAFEYDAAGNMTRLGDRTLRFGADGKVVEIRGAKGTRSSFRYDGDGNLISQDSVYGPKQHGYRTSYFSGVQLIRERYSPPQRGTTERTIVRHTLASSAGTFGFYDKVYNHYPYRFVASVYGRAMTQKPERVTDLRFAFSYLVKDQVGSIRAVLSEDGKIVDRFRYDPWGKRIEAEGYRYRHVKQGFTGHEMLDNLGLVHMGGRVYDPLLGRFISADPLLQAPFFSQSYNRYSYVLNNPLVLVDPTGHGWFSRAVRGFFRAVERGFRDVVDAVVGKPLAWVGDQLAKGGRWLEQNWQTVAIIAIAAFVPVAATWYLAALQGAAMGGLSAALYGGGPDEILRGALIGGATGGAFHGVGTAGISDRALAAGAHGVVGGVSSVAQGGSFQSGFLSAAITKASGSYLPAGGSQAYQVASAAVVGGVASQIGGGSFENGAVTGAFSRLFNDLAHPEVEAEFNRAPASSGEAYEVSGCLGGTVGVGASVCGTSMNGPIDGQVSFGGLEKTPFGPSVGYSVSAGESGISLGAQAGYQAGFGLTSATVGVEVNITRPVDTNFSGSVRVGPIQPQIKVYPVRIIMDVSRQFMDALRNLEPNIQRLYNVPQY